MGLSYEKSTNVVLLPVLFNITSNDDMLLGDCHAVKYTNLKKKECHTVKYTIHLKEEDCHTAKYTSLNKEKRFDC